LIAGAKPAALKTEQGGMIRTLKTSKQKSNIINSQFVELESQRTTRFESPPT
jgi:hypothetical protein